MAIPGLFLIYFRLFKKHYNFTTNKCERCPTSIWCWDLNPRPSEHESPPITTRPGLPPCFLLFYQRLLSVYCVTVRTIKCLKRPFEWHKGQLQFSRPPYMNLRVEWIFNKDVSILAQTICDHKLQSIAMYNHR